MRHLPSSTIGRRGRPSSGNRISASRTTSRRYSCLTGRAPIEPSCIELRHLDGGAAHQTWQAMAPVDGHGITGLHASNWPGAMFRQGCHNPPGFDPCPHQCPRIPPYPIPRLLRYPSSLGVRIQPCPEKKFGAVDIADACHYFLVHQQCGDWLAARRDSLPSVLWVRIITQRVWS